MTVNRFFSEMHFGACVTDCSAEQLKRYGLALLHIVGADRLSAKELATYEEIARHLGTSEEIVAELGALDPATIDLDEVLEGLGDDFSTRTLLYDAIVIASSDGYTEKEQAAAAHAAKLLGISDSVRKSIEQLVALEAAHRKMKAALLKLR